MVTGMRAADASPASETAEYAKAEWTTSVAPTLRSSEPLVEGSVMRSGSGGSS